MGSSHPTDFYWWFGVVESVIDDPLSLGRVRCRVHGYHSPHTKNIKTEELMWAKVLMPTTSACVSGKGQNHSLQPGSWVLGFWTDQNESQQPMILGTWWGNTPTDSDGNSGNDMRTDGGLKSGVQINPGDGFKSPKLDRDKYPKKVTKFKSPEGYQSEGNDHGIQLTDVNLENYPLPEYKNRSELHPLHTNECEKEKSLSKDNPTLKKLKSMWRQDGGLLDDGFNIYSNFQIPFECGVIKSLGGSSLNDYGFGGQKNKITSTTKKDQLDQFKPYSEKPLALNDGGEVVYDKKNIINISI